MPSLPVPRLLGALAGLVALAGAWLLLAPPALGGKTSFVITSGNSMEPKLHEGDLVLTRERASYGVGDIVLFRSTTLGRDVLHRIVALEGERFVTGGDNNDYRDPGRVAPGQVQGEAVLFLPGAGKPLAWLRRPLHAAVVLFALVFLSLGGGRQVARARGRSAVRPVQPLTPAHTPSPLARAAGAAGARTVLVAGAAALGLFALLAVAAWRAPATTPQPVGQAYEHTGRFSYSAAVRRSAVYPDGSLTTGEAAFTKLVRRLEVAFDYRFETTRRHDVRGGIALDAVIGDGAGWSRRIPVDSAAPFDGDSARAAGVLDLRRLEGLAARMRTLTGSGASTFTVTIEPHVQVAGYAGGAVVDEAFSPQLRLVLDPVSLRPDTGAGEAASALSPRQQGSVVEQQPSRIGLGAVAIPVTEARAFSALGLGVALLVVLAAALVLPRRPDRPEAERIGARYGDRIVTAAAVIPEGRWVTEVPDIESLVRLADRYDRVVLHTTEGSRDAYLVDDGVAVYRYRTVPDTSGVRLPGVSPLPGQS